MVYSIPIIFFRLFLFMPISILHSRKYEYSYSRDAEAIISAYAKRRISFPTPLRAVFDGLPQFQGFLGAQRARVLAPLFFWRSMEWRLPPLLGAMPYCLTWFDVIEDKFS